MCLKNKELIEYKTYEERGGVQNEDSDDVQGKDCVAWVRGRPRGRGVWIVTTRPPSPTSPAMHHDSINVDALRLGGGLRACNDKGHSLLVTAKGHVFRQHCGCMFCNSQAA